MAHGDSVDELKNAFELVEKSSPGITDDFVKQIISRLTSRQSLPESQLHRVFNQLKLG